MLSNKEWMILGLCILLFISIFQKLKPSREGFSFRKKRKAIDRKQEGLEKMNEKLEKDVEKIKNKLNIKKYKKDYEGMLIELHDNIGNESIKNLYDKQLNKSTRTYNLQQEGLNNLAKYLKNYKD